jgi:adenosylcobinamide kinase/adenosylcobinamide-phosphate guanylyltransferase
MYFINEEKDMGKMILITGGARSGKSGYAEDWATQLDTPILYIATAIPFDEEMKIRIRKHQQSRPAHWETYEGFKELGKVIEKKGKNFGGVLLDCVTILVSNLLFDFCKDASIEEVDFEKMERLVLEEIKSLVSGSKNTNATVILVTNELGSGVVPENRLARAFRDMAGRINQYLGSEADEVYLCVCGIPMKVK